MAVLENLPADLPIPIDDGVCNYLLGRQIPNVLLSCTDETIIDLQDLKGRLVIYCYPMTGRPDIKLPDGWEQIPGARGCTPQSCSFRDHYNELQKLNTNVFGLSTQTKEYQKEVKDRLHLLYELLSDKDLQFSNALQLPFHLVDNMTLTKRVTLIFDEGKIVKYGIILMTAKVETGYQFGCYHFTVAYFSPDVFPVTDSFQQIIYNTVK